MVILRWPLQWVCMLVCFCGSSQQAWKIPKTLEAKNHTGNNKLGMLLGNHFPTLRQSKPIEMCLKSHGFQRGICTLWASSHLSAKQLLFCLTKMIQIHRSHCAKPAEGFLRSLSVLSEEERQKKRGIEYVKCEDKSSTLLIIIQLNTAVEAWRARLTMPYIAYCFRVYTWQQIHLIRPLV